jgi:hypothetical protein
MAMIGCRLPRVWGAVKSIFARQGNFAREPPPAVSSELFTWRAPVVQGGVYAAAYMIGQFAENQRIIRTYLQQCRP